ncbi:response regulator [Muricomes sp. OA1]|nr:MULTISPECIES: response regulator [Clostridia]MCH1971871.1 response regulator [Muricomes sp. OA1]GKH30670.1 hypothetical protein CE91St64_00770 [Faecalicatena contorta]
MYRIMIVDDELIIREGISTFIDWEGLDCQIAHSASDGLEAVEFLQTACVDIIITDIRMPGKNGLELAEYVRKYAPSTKLIILSGYSDFKYAQEALRHGAFDFILKDNPLSKIENAVRRAISAIQEEQKKQRQFDSIQETIIKNQEELQIKFYQDLVYDVPLSPDEIIEKSRLYQVSGTDFYCILIKIRIIGDSAQLKEDFINTIARFLRGIFASVKPVIFPVHSRYLCIVLNDTRKLAHTPIVPSLNQIFTFAESYPEYRLKAAISTPHSSITELNTAYLECCYCFKHNAKSDKKILFYSDENNTSSPSHSQNLPIKKAVQFIENNYNEQIGLTDIADAVGLNASYLSRLFKKETGESVTEHLTLLRIEKAKKLLKDDSLRLRDVAMAVGFNDVSYFSNTFKKIAGMSPTEFRMISEIN